MLRLSIYLFEEIIIVCFYIISQAQIKRIMCENILKLTVLNREHLFIDHNVNNLMIFYFSYKNIKVKCKEKYDLKFGLRIFTDKCLYK